jgi:proteic killer suppression protein
MDIEDFDSPELEKICKFEREAKHKLGAPCAKKLKTRLAEIQAASFVTDLIAGKPHALDRERTGQYAVSLEGFVRLTFEPTNSPIPTNDGKIDWSKVNKVKIVYIGNYHDY